MPRTWLEKGGEGEEKLGGQDEAALWGPGCHSLVVNWRRGEVSTVFEPERHRMTLDFGKIHLEPGTGGNGQGGRERK